MNSLRKVLGFLMVMMLVGFALPSSAGPAKQYSLTMTPKSVLSVSGPIKATAKFVNQTPNGNSTFLSVILHLPLPATSGLTIQPSPITLEYATSDGGTLIPAVGQPALVVTATDQQIQIQNINPPIKPNWELLVTFYVTATNCASVNANYTAEVFTGSNFGIDHFNFLPQFSSVTTSGCDGQINCNEAFPSSPGPGVSDAFRGLWNKDGSTCVAVNYDFTNTIATDNSVFLQWETNLQSAAAFKYTATWQPEFVDPVTGGLATVTKLAWDLLPDGVTPRYEPGRACVSHDLPAPLGTLVADLGATIQVNVTVVTLPPVPFPIVIGGTGANGAERMTVTGVSGSANPYTFAVNRGVGNTDISVHTVGFYVMTTPLPIINDPTSFYFGEQAHACIWDEGWIAIGMGYCPTDPTKLCAKVQKSTSIFDIGDAWGIGD